MADQRPKVLSLRRYSIISLFLVLLAAVSCFAAGSTDGVFIVNKAHLPPARLAEAIAAKAVLQFGGSEGEKLLLIAASTDPSNPVYPYLLARMNAKGDWGAGEVDYTPARPFLERSLKADPNYLPALYALAMSEATHQQRMEALQGLTRIDANNAEPYYLMAMESFFEITKGRKITAATDRDAFEMSQQEWTQVSDLIEKGNARSVFEWRAPASPSTRDVRITYKGKVWPEQAVQGFAQLTLHTDYLAETADSRFSPLSISGNAYWRQLARQAMWAARNASKSGDNDRALHYLTVMMGCGRKYAGCKPERMTTFLVGECIWQIAGSTAEEVLEKKPDATMLTDLRSKKAEWKAGCNQLPALLKRSNITVKSIKISREEYLTYNDYAVEEAGVRKIVASLRP